MAEEAEQQHKEAGQIWFEWEEHLREGIVGNPLDHPSYPFNKKHRHYYEQLEQALKVVSRHIKFYIHPDDND